MCGWWCGTHVEVLELDGAGWPGWPRSSALSRQPVPAGLALGALQALWSLGARLAALAPVALGSGGAALSRRTRQARHAGSAHLTLGASRPRRSRDHLRQQQRAQLRR